MKTWKPKTISKNLREFAKLREHIAGLIPTPTGYFQSLGFFPFHHTEGAPARSQGKNAALLNMHTHVFSNPGHISEVFTSLTLWWIHMALLKGVKPTHEDAGKQTQILRREISLSFLSTSKERGPGQAVEEPPVSIPTGWPRASAVKKLSILPSTPKQYRNIWDISTVVPTRGRDWRICQGCLLETLSGYNLNAQAGFLERICSRIFCV